MRIAWIGPARDMGGVPGMGRLLLEGIVAQGVEVDFFTTDALDELAKSVKESRQVAVVREEPRWSWGKWYSRKPFRAFITGTLARARAYSRLISQLIERNKQRHYDCIFQVSQLELFKLGRYRKQLPPIVVYPCVHAAGELRWHRKESRYALQSEKWFMHYIMRMILIYRSMVQKRQVQKPAMVLGMSKRFNELLSQDYALDPRRQAVLYHPILPPFNGDLPPVTQTAWHPGRPVRLLFVARISVRKGLDQIVALSHRLDDLQGQIQIDVIGDKTLWSDYMAHLKELNPHVARYLGSLKHGPMMQTYNESDILLLPSLYEPGGLVVGESLSRGVCAVVSDEVGSAEPVDGDCCRKFPAGDLDAFEKQTRQMILDVKARPQRLRESAMAEATEHFKPEKIGRRLFELLQSAAAGGKAVTAGDCLAVGSGTSATRAS